MVGLYNYVLGNMYGYQYGDAFDGAQLQYANDKFRATAGYGKFKEGANALAVKGSDFEGNGILGVKTGYGELEGFFGGGKMADSAVGVYYNDFSGGEKGFNVDNLWGTYASLNFGKWNILAEYQQLSNDAAGDPEVWYGKVQYGKVAFDTPKTWDVWIEHLDADDKAFLCGSDNTWRFGNGMFQNTESWGVGVDYMVDKNLLFSVMQSFGTNAKHGKDPEEISRAQFILLF